MNTRNKLMIYSAALLMSTGVASAQENSTDNQDLLNPNAAMPAVEYDRVAANNFGNSADTPYARPREGRFNRFMHRFHPRDTAYSPATDAVEIPGVAPTSDTLIKRNSLD